MVENGTGTLGQDGIRAARRVTGGAVRGAGAGAVHGDGGGAALGDRAGAVRDDGAGPVVVMVPVQFTVMVLVQFVETAFCCLSCWKDMSTPVATGMTLHHVSFSSGGKKPT